jgi:hypothetical protein
MPSEPAGDEGTRWLLQPPSAGELHVHVAVGEGTELTPRLKAALDQLVAALYQEEVAGYAADCSPRCPDLRSCGTFDCLVLNNCIPLSSAPCVADVRCKIANVAF